MSVSPASRPSAHLSPRLKNLALRSIVGLILVVLGVLSLLFQVIAESMPALNVFVEFLKLFTNAIPWLDLTIGRIGLPLIVFGIVGIVFAIWQFKRGARVTTPEETLKSFYQYGVLDVLESDEIAWNCLTPEGRAQFGAIEHFKNHWKRLREEFATRNLAFWSYLLIQNVVILQEDDNSCTVSFDIAANDPRSFWRDPLHMKRFLFHQTATLRKSKGNWYLTPGKLDFSDSNRIPYDSLE